MKPTSRTTLPLSLFLSTLAWAADELPAGTPATTNVRGDACMNSRRCCS